ncbi:Phosphate-specific transport system accessory protein [Desulfonema limicola]|uniref:Phosphate-specific transport system accessory protein PhoU n=1 Tax=Desulfonema limicola TaxID=45656 RepID=A0A975BE31_9BACT|nr:phosphate signaling complex protein PhoU [Desulfonema limicola]QTA83585.1 Phosphate-specific transport system accessory protein [Desulfonema limicola]
MARHFQIELDKLKKRILALGAMVEDRVRRAAKAIESREIFDARQIVKSDYEVDVEEVEIEEECLKILALYQPVAVDLRFIIATIKINSELERIADEAVNIAQRMKQVIKKQNGCSVIYDYSQMAEKVREMLKKSLDALVNIDVDLAFKILLLDDEVDKLYVEMYNRFKDDLKKEPEYVEYFTNMFLIARHLERIGDHATNIAEEVIYLIEGEIVRHGNY